MTFSTGGGGGEGKRKSGSHEESHAVFRTESFGDEVNVRGETGDDAPVGAAHLVEPANVLAQNAVDIEVTNTLGGGMSNMKNVGRGMNYIPTLA